MEKIGKLERLLIYFLIGFCCFSFSVLADERLEVHATVDRNSMEEGDTFILSVEVTSQESLNISEPKLPQLKNLDLVNSWSSSQTSSTYSNGQFRVEQSRTFNYMLAPTKTGTIRIDPVTVVAKGGTYKTNSIDIEVRKGDGSSNRPSTPDQRKNQNQNHGSPDPLESFEDMDQLFSQLFQRRRGGGNKAPPINPNESFFIQVDVDKTKVYEGEQIIASWSIYTRGLIRDIDTLKYPSLNGFWKEEIDLATRLDWQNEIINGIAYKKALLVSYALFPVKAGKAVIDPYKAKCAVMTDSVFGFGRQYFYTKSSKAIDIEVLPIPTEGRPIDYAGGVGEFAVTASLSDGTVSVNQPVTLKVRFDGQGNGKWINLPKMKFPAGVEIYDTKSESKYFKNGQSYKEFEVLLIPREAGTITIPSLSFSLFNPREGKFYQRLSNELPLQVTGDGKAPTISSLPMESKKQVFSEESKKNQNQLPGISMEWEEKSWVLPIPFHVFWMSVYLFVFVILLVSAFLQMGWLKKAECFQSLCQSRLRKIEKIADSGNWRGVGIEGTNLIYLILEKLARNSSGHQELNVMLLNLSPSLRRELEQSVRQLMTKLERLGFAPIELVGHLKEKKELKKLVGELETLAKKSFTFFEEPLSHLSEGKMV